MRNVGVSLPVSRLSSPRTPPPPAPGAPSQDKACGETKRLRRAENPQHRRGGSRRSPSSVRSPNPHRPRGGGNEPGGLSEVGGEAVSSRTLLYRGTAAMAAAAAWGGTRRRLTGRAGPPCSPGRSGWDPTPPSKGPTGECWAGAHPAAPRTGRPAGGRPGARLRGTARSRCRAGPRRRSGARAAALPPRRGGEGGPGQAGSCGCFRLVRVVNSNAWRCCPP